MEQYIGIKLASMRPMLRSEYHAYRRDHPFLGCYDPDGSNDEGYFVEAFNGERPNHPDHKGYIHWMPKEQAYNAYRPVTGMTFSIALELLKRGKKVSRQGWKKQFLFFPAQIEIMVSITLRKVIPWVAEQKDLIAEDWREVSY